MPLASRSLIRKLRPRSRTGWIGVDLGSLYVKLAQVELVDGNPQLTEAIAAPLPQSARFDEQSLETGWLSELLREELSLNRGFRGRKAACVLSMSASDFRSVMLPPGSAKETREMISQELTDSGLGGADTLEFDFWDGARTSSEPDAATAVNVLSVSRGVATQIAQQLRVSGLTCQVLDGSPFALARAIQMVADTPPEPATAVGILDWSGSSAQFTVVVNGEPAFTRVLKDCGMRPVVESIRAGLELPLEDCHELLATHGIADPGADGAAISEVQELVAELAAEPFNRLIKELQKTSAFLVSQRPELVPKAMWLVGGGAAILNAEARLTFALGLPVRPWRLSRRATSATRFRASPVPMFAQAAALSQLGLES